MGQTILLQRSGLRPLRIEGRLLAEAQVPSRTGHGFALRVYALDDGRFAAQAVTIEPGPKPFHIHRAEIAESLGEALAFLNAVDAATDLRPPVELSGTRAGAAHWAEIAARLDAEIREARTGYEACLEKVLTHVAPADAAAPRSHRIAS